MISIKKIENHMCYEIIVFFYECNLLNIFLSKKGTKRGYT